MRLSRNAFWSGETEKRKDRLAFGIRHHRIPKGLWYLILPDETDHPFRGLFAFISAEEAHRNRKMYRTTTVIGVAGSRAGARDLSAKIVDRVFHETGGFDVRTWFGEGRT